eukprot:symbB.v1.2.035501.t1/scaffold4766.1/size35193/2
MPDFIVGEEARLRTLEKQRFAEKGRVTKSTSRSTEAVAQKLTQPQKVIDAGAELRKANTQAELCRVQRRLADLERRSDSADSALGPKLLHVNKWIKAEAEQQKVNLAAGKTKDGKDKSQLTAGGPAPSYSWTSSGGTAGGNPDFSASSAAGSPELQVECRSCNTTLPWSQLADGDGSCSQCRAQGLGAGCCWGASIKTTCFSVEVSVMRPRQRQKHQKQSTNWSQWILLMWFRSRGLNLPHAIDGQNDVSKMPVKALCSAGARVPPTFMC